MKQPQGYGSLTQAGIDDSTSDDGLNPFLQQDQGSVRAAAAVGDELEEERIGAGVAAAILLSTGEATIISE
eukprot:scaffold3321_cov69-Cylindrotheca_fusiformis.AAC.2